MTVGELHELAHSRCSRWEPSDGRQCAEDAEGWLMPPSGKGQPMCQRCAQTVIDEYDQHPEISDLVGWSWKAA